MAVSCESLPRSHSAVVCGGWHLALRLSCLPPPLFSALQWDHVVLLISQQWPYSLPFPLFSLSTFPHSLLSSSPTSPTHAADYLQPLSSCHVDSLHFIRSVANLFLFSPHFLPALLHQPPTHPALWSLGCRSPVLQVSPERRSTLWRPQLLLKKKEYILRKTEKYPVQLFSNLQRHLTRLRGQIKRCVFD